MIARMVKTFIPANYSAWPIKVLRCWLLLIACFMTLCLSGCNEHIVGMLNPKGIIAYEERKLFFDTLALMLIVVLPVIVMSFAFIYHYQVSHRVRDYKPNWSHSFFLEALWWGIPCIIIFVLALLTWKKTYELDPTKPIPSFNESPMFIQVIALPWKWLFIYPKQGIATVNDLMIAVGQPIEFWITTDNVPMSAFFIPQLGSQIYTMAGMRTRLHLIANQIGEYDGMNTQYNGSGFSDMHFKVHVVEPDVLQQWFNQIKNTSNRLTETAYIELLKPSIGQGPQYFSDVPADLFKNVVDTYRHSLGTVHPRTNQAKFYNPI